MTTKSTKTQEQYSPHIPAMYTLAALGAHDGKTYGRMSEAHNVHGLLWIAGVKYAAQKGTFFANIRITTPAAPLLQAYQGRFFSSFPKSLNLNADLLRWVSSPKPRFFLPPIGGKLGAYPICRAEYRQAEASADMGGCP